MQDNRIQNLKLAERGAFLSIAAYIVLSILQIVVAGLVHSDALRANGFNNITDILGNIALLIGLRMARVPADANHVYGHWKVESISSLISSFIMALVGFELLRETVSNILTNSQTEINAAGAWVGVFSALLMFSVFLYNRRLAKNVSSPALEAASKDNLTDGFTSLGTSVAIVAASFNLLIIDRIVALFICGIIFWTAYSIFRDSAFSLSDGFDEHLLDQYREAIESIDKVQSIRLLRGRTYGSNIYLDVIIRMSPDMSVLESHATTEIIERTLREQFNVYDTDVHVEPSPLPDEEKEPALVLHLLDLEERLISGEDLRADTFLEIDEKGNISKDVTQTKSGIMNFKYQHISKRTYILYYSMDGDVVSSTWRRNGDWHCIFRQITKK